MLKNILIIDDSKTFRKYASVAFSLEWPDVYVEEYDPLVRGKPASDFPWHQYDVLLLDYQLGLEETGLDWLAEFSLHPQLPITIMLTGEGSEQVAVNAMKLGANDYVTKSGQAFGRVIDTIREAIEFRVRTEQAAKESGSDDNLPNRVMSAQEVLRARDGNWPVQSPDRRDQTVTLTPEELAAVRTVRVMRVQQRIEETESGVPLPPGYRFVKELGEKSLSLVVLAEREEDDKPVVLKVLSTIEVGDDPAAFKRFIQEYTLISHVSHPHIVRIYEQNFSIHHAFIAMEYFPRGNMAERLAQGIRQADALRYLREMAYGLRAVHDMDIVHRDLKPSNILFRQDDSLAITDFGIAKVLRGRQNLTLDGIVIGTPNYMSPEQAVGDAADRRSDIYSLGIICYQMLAGQLPYEADDVMGLLYAHVHREPNPLPEPASRYQPIIDQMLAKSMDDRYQNVDELLEALGGLSP